MTNPFLLSSIEDQQAQPPANANPFALQAIQNDQRQDLRNTLTGAVRENPDAAAEAARLAKRYPAPVDVLARNLQDVKLQEMVDKADETLQTSPKLAEYLRTKPWTTQQSHDDINPLSAVEQVFNVARSVPAGAARGLGGIASGAGELLDIGARATGLGTLSRLVREATGIDPNVALDVAGSFKVLGKGGKAIADAIGVDPANRNFATDVGEGIGQLLQQIGVQIATGGTASLATLFAQGADAMATKTEKDNASQAMRDTAVLTGSAITALTEKYGVDALLNRVPPAIKNNALRWVADKLVAGGIEATQEITEGVLQDLVRVALTNPDADIGDGALYEGGVAATSAAIVRAALGVRVRSNVEIQRANEAQQHAQKLQEAMTVAAQSKLRERNPETFRDLAATLTDNTTVYVDAQVLAQSATELAEALPAVAEQLEDALASNSTVEVSIADILTLAPGTPLEQVFLQNARQAPDALSLADADQASKQAEQYLQQEAERVMQQAADTQAWQQSSEAVRTEILGQLSSTGRFTADVNEAYATLQSNFFSTMAARTGMTPTELYQRYSLKVAAKQVGQGGVLNAGGTLADVTAQWDAAGIRNSVSEKNGVITLKQIVVPGGQRSQGVGTQAMQALVTYADATGQRIELGASSQLGGDKARLVEFYERFGFARKPRSAPVSKPFKDTAMAREPVQVFNQSGFDQTQTEDFKRFSNNAPLVAADAAETYGFKTGEKIVVEAFHGTKRPDRVGTKFLKKRATSGPMAYHTSDPALASSYATGKQDTSLSDEDQSYETWFKYKPKGQRSAVDIVRAWNFLDAETKAKIAKTAPTLRLNEDLDGVISEEGNTGGNGSYDYNLSQTRTPYNRQGNPIKALVEDWLNSGNLFNEEETFMEVLQKAGFPMADVTYDSPTAEYPFVYKNYITMQKPLVTSDVPQEVVDALNAAAKKDRSRAKGAGADMWDKNTRTLKSWVETFNEPDNKYVWTSIPDKVTDVFRSLGYDGIVDWSGKGGGTVAPVYIPFEETQVKSALGNKGKFDTTKNDILKQFAGPNAQTADKLALSTAQQRLDGGENTEKVRKETGWFKGADGKWRFEIDDANAKFVDAPKLKAWLLGEKPGRKGLNAADARELKKLKPQTETLNDELFDTPVEERKSAKFAALLAEYNKIDRRVKQLEGRSEGKFDRLGDVLDHPALYAAYPEIANYTVILRVDPTRKSRADGFFNQDQQHIHLETQDFESMLDSLLHEVQHGIQSVEGFAMGGSVKTDDASLPAEVVSQIRQLNDAADAAGLKAEFAEARRLRGEADKLRAAAGFEQYQKLAGEVEARNVERRRKMTAAERQAAPPSATADVADSDVIVVFNGKEMQSAPAPANATPLLQGPRGTFSPSQLLLTLNENADLSTFLHESGHFFLEVLADLSSQPNAPQQIQDDMAATLKWFGVPDLATWNGYTLDQKRPYHERWAESFEQYLFEGKAPSPELQPLFRRFRSWLVNVYQSLTQFMRARDLKVNDEVRQVFDRLVATDEQIAQAEESAGMLPDFDATNEAIEQLQARSLRDLKWTVKARGKVLKALEKEAKTLRKEVEAEVRAEVEQQPLYKAMNWLKKGETTDPATGDVVKVEKGYRLLTTALAEMYPETMLSRPDLTGLRGMTGKEGLHPDMVADMFGFESGDKLVRAILDAEPIASVIEGMTDQRMLERHGDLATPEAREAAANEAVHNEARARSLATELKSQAEMLNPRQDTGRTASNGRAITVNAITAAAKQFAENLAARRRIKDLKNAAWQHRSAEARAGKAWQAATAKADTQAAVQAKRDQVLNNAAVKALQDAQLEVRKIVEFFKRVTKGNDEKVVERGRDPDVVNAMRAILAAYDVAPRLEKTALAYMETVAKNDPAMYAALQPSVQGAMLNAKPMVEMTMEELRGLNDELRAMWVLAKRSRQMEVDGNLLDLEDAADQLVERMGEIGIPDTIPGEKGAITDKQERGIKLQFAKAILSRVEQWSERLDGKFGGPFLRLVFQPVKDAADRYRTDKEAYRKKFAELVKNVAPSLPAGPIEAPELGYTFGNARDSGAAELLHAILHTGNDSNKRKLLLGRGWATQDAEGNLDTTQWDAFIQRMQAEGKVNKAHYDFAQGVWDLLEEMKPLAQETHRKVLGRYFAEVTANEVVTPFGTYRGGYVPAQTDSRLVKDAKLRELAEGENESMAYAFPAAPSGFTKGRVEYNQPLLLDLRALGQHMDKVLLFSHMQGAVTDVRRLLTNKRVSYALDRIDPGAYEGMLIPWLNRSARQVVETPVVGDRKISRFLSAARSRAGMALMFANLSNTVQQITGFTLASVKVKPGLMMSATARFMADPKAMKTTVAEASPYMKDRMLNEVGAMNDAVEQILVDPTLLERGQAWTQRHAYFMQAAVDNTMSPIIWTAAYNQAIEQGMENKEAVRFADGVIRQTQGTTLPEDISRFESGPGYARLFTQFVSYFNMMANTNGTAVSQIADEVGLKKGAGKVLYVAIAGLLAPIWVAEAIAQVFRGGPEDEDKDGWLDDWLLAVFGLGTLKGLTAQIPIVGQAGQLVINRFNDNPADDKFSLSPAVSLIESTVSAPSSVYKAIVEDGNKQRAVRDVAAAATMITGLPIYGVARPIGYLAGIAGGNIEPTGPADLARGLVTGTASPESKQR